MQNFEESRHLINSFAELNSEKTNNNQNDNSQNKKSLINEIDYIDVLINTLNTEVDNLINDIDQINFIIDNAKEQKA
jgi:hypothetical protein